MKNMKKLLLTMFAMLTLVFALQVSTSAAGFPASYFKVTVAKGKLAAEYIGPNTYENHPYYELQFQIVDPVKKIAKNTAVINKVGYTWNIAANKVYWIRVRGHETATDNWSSWSAYRAAMFVNPTASVGSGPSIKIKLPNVKGVSKYLVYSLTGS